VYIWPREFKVAINKQNWNNLMSYFIHSQGDGRRVIKLVHTLTRGCCSGEQSCTPELWGCSCSTILFFFGSGIEPMASPMLGKCCTMEIHPSPRTAQFQTANTQQHKRLAKYTTGQAQWTKWHKWYDCSFTMLLSHGLLWHTGANYASHRKMYTVRDF
jgi:hypothetical protein